MRLVLASTALLLVGVLTVFTGRGGPTDHTAADVDFARTMIRYHDQALVVATTAADHATDPAVQELARQMRDTYQPQLDELVALLKEWRALDVDDPRGPDLGDAPEIKSPPLPGMLSPEQTRELARADGGTFDALFLRRMIDHHDGSVDAGRSELAGGTHPGARALSRRILDQEANTVATMRHLAGPH